jgi:isopenicillin N synthase-like dioxygenase
MPDGTTAPSVDDNISSQRLPIVDIASYLTDSSTPEERQKTAKTLDDACRQFGMLTFSTIVLRDQE